MAEQRVQRRLTAILAADVVGYGRLIEADEAGTRARLRSLHSELIDPRIAADGGRIVKTTGDGILVEFPSAVDAVENALAIQSAMAGRNAEWPEEQRLVFRVGVNLGDVIIEGDDIHGDGVNVAARLEGLCDPGEVFISGTVRDHVEGKLEAAFDDLGEQMLKNISRPTRVYRVHTASKVAAVGSNKPAGAPSIPDRPSIAVLPFENMSGDPDQEYFSDGMTEDIITELSRFENLFVIARNTTFTYKGQRTDVRAVAQELGVHFILEGSVRKVEERVRITAQLINGQDGGHVWAERYDGALENVFDLQEQVTSQVVGSISPQISEAEIERIERGERKFDEAHELAWRAQATSRSAFRLSDPAMLDRAIAMAIEAAEMNAQCGVAYETVSFAYALQSLFRWGDDPKSSADHAEEWAKRFLAQLPKSYMAYFCLGLARFRKGRYQDANRDFRHAHDLNPNEAVVLRVWAWCEASSGEFESAKQHAHMALRLSPKDTLNGVAYLALAMAAFAEKEAAEFEEWADKAIRAQPHAPIRRAMMIAYAAEAGNQALLETHRAELMRFAPDFVDSLFRGENQLFHKPEHMAILLDGLRKAGFPE